MDTALGYLRKIYYHALNESTLLLKRQNYETCKLKQALSSKGVTFKCLYMLRCLVSISKW